MGGLVTTAGDLLLWDRALADGVVLGEEALAKYFTAVIPARDKKYALGWFVWDREPGGRRQQHGGAVRGFLSDFRRLPDRDACIAVLHNGKDRILPYIVENLECLLLGHEPRHVIPPAVVAITKDKLVRCAGHYEHGGKRVEVRVEGDHLVAIPADEASWHEIVVRKVWGASGPLVLQPTRGTTFVHFAHYGASQLEFSGKKQASSFSLRSVVWKRER
jgi:hypothetical protein